MKSARSTSKKTKKLETLSQSEEKPPSPSQQKEEKEEKQYASPKKPWKGKDIAKIASMIRAQKVRKLALRPVSRSKYFDFASLKKKGWNLRECPDSQGWSSFVSLQKFTFQDLVREFYASTTIKEKKEEKFLITAVKGMKIKNTQEFLSKALKIPNEGNKLFFNSWFNDLGLIRDQRILEYTKPNLEFISTYLQDVPKILHNMIRHWWVNN